MLRVYLAEAAADPPAPAWVTWATLAGVIATALGAYLGVRHTARVAADANRIAREALAETTTTHRREEWWKRAQWAMEQACDDSHNTGASGATPTLDHGQKVGIAVLRWLAKSLLAQREERDMIKDVLLIVMTP